MTYCIQQHTQGMRRLPLPATLMAAFLTALLLLMAPAAYSQHIMGGGAGASDVEMQPSPADDQVLAASPEELMLRFSTYVRLVKLTLKAPDQDIVNIGFRYSPEASRVFFWELPELPVADYYTVEWAAIDPSNLVAKGSFNFAFGSEALPPSQVIPTEEELQHVTVPDFRLLNLGL